VPDVIRVTDVTKEYGTAVKTLALRGVSFRVETKEFLSIIGQSGSGKSTLLNLLGLLDTPTTGTVELLGTDVGGLSKKERALFRNEHLGFVFQFHHLLPEFSVRENLLIPTWIGSGVRRGVRGPGDTDGPRMRANASTRARAEEILSFLGVGDLADKNAEQLSGGQKQRVAIGRALMKSPDILLADEPTGNLDTANSAMVYELFRRIHDEMGTTFIIVTHDRGIAQQADRIIEVTDGLVSQDVRNEYLRG
jgi:lipoprotein-releasing system ATP-binding protein